ncbi:hypothetical protein J7363_04115 [Phaeobacter italicus]|nr:hypothetical protein [Phaeobacter italicus]
MAAASPFKTFEPGAAGTLLERQKIPPDFPEADIPHCPISHGNAAPRSNVAARNSGLCKLSLSAC